MTLNHAENLSPLTCDRVILPNPTEDHSQEKAVFSLLNRASSSKLGDECMAADVASMSSKFGWWNVVDGAMLQRFSCEKPNSPVERWFRLEKKAAKVGKGLVKNKKGRKLVSQHWLEAIDPLHRYGHNLRFYFEAWCHTETNEPFFHWLDSGEGKDLDLEECPRDTLHNERIRYLSPAEREQYEVIVEDGKLVYKLSREPVNSTKGDRWIFVMSTDGVLYIGKKERGNLQHSSFLAGAAITSAGRLRVSDGIIKRIEAHSGHYRPTLENFKQVISLLESRGADLSTATVEYSSKEMMKPSKSSSDLKADEKDQTTDKVEDALQSPLSRSLSSPGSPKDCDWQLGDKGNEEHDVMNALAGLKGKHDIFRKEGPGVKQGSPLETNVMTDNGQDPSNGQFPQKDQPNTDGRESSKSNGTDAGFERAHLGGLGSEMRQSRSQDDEELQARAAQEPVSLQDQEVVEENIEHLAADHASQSA
ncbi:hypothetical protein R1sor_016308 [Riccia sorocarpa]|uniref:Calmodulin-binding protein n=1 Tax=Riccia sorocarpa TaxID=122646 RepID=A0ABD3HHT3_9MARC